MSRIAGREIVIGVSGGIAAFVDAEHALDPSYAKKLGVDLDNLLVSQPDTGEQALEITDMLVRSGAVDIIVIDSVAALTPKAEIEGEMGDSHVGLQARLMSQALRKLTGVVSRTGTIIIFINQIRMKIGVMFGSPETTSGGNALKFYASVRLDVRRLAANERAQSDDRVVLTAVDELLGRLRDLPRSGDHRACRRRCRRRSRSRPAAANHASRSRRRAAGSAGPKTGS